MPSWEALRPGFLLMMLNGVRLPVAVDATLDQTGQALPTQHFLGSFQVPSLKIAFPDGRTFMAPFARSMLCLGLVSQFLHPLRPVHLASLISSFMSATTMCSKGASRTKMEKRS